MYSRYISKYNIKRCVDGDFVMRARFFFFYFLLKFNIHFLFCLGFVCIAHRTISFTLNMCVAQRAIRNSRTSPFLYTHTHTHPEK